MLNIFILLGTADLPCASDNECSHGCAIVHGEEECFCPLGFELSEDGTQCIGEMVSKFIMKF